MIQKDIKFKEYFGFTPYQLKWAIPNQKSQNCLQRIAYIIDWMGQNFGDLLQGQIYVGVQNISLLRGFGTQFLLEGKRPDGVTIDPIKHGDYYYWVFKDVGTGSVEVKAKNGGSVDFLLVGGGGSGGYETFGGGGGGAGGIVIKNNHSLSNGTYAIAIGVGAQDSLKGGNSSFGDIIAYGGGSGGNRGTNNKPGSPGASGGGGGRPAAEASPGAFTAGGLAYTTVPDTSPPEPLIPKQGNDGGKGHAITGGILIAGGGGGANTNVDGRGTGKDGNSTTGKGGDGGDGISIMDIWTELLGATISGDGNYLSDLGVPAMFCYGGGGAAGSGGSKGLGWNGNGDGQVRHQDNPTPGLANSGGGGGGHAGTDNYNAGSAGGSGICVIRIEVTKNIVIQAIQQYYNENIEEVVINNTATMQDVLEVMNRINQKWQQ